MLGNYYALFRDSLYLSYTHIMIFNLIWLLFLFNQRFDEVQYDAETPAQKPG
jgi:hypothetical protein